ncbi:EP1-like glycoprotein 4 [Typha latifolia]|uniref:EP1-like glycoprotein 4 n=1 Tax=Typha latifolia TaxID=4733 RepID=UPI003C2DB692
MESNILLFVLLSSLSLVVLCRLDFPLGGQVTIPIPSAYQPGFVGRAFVLDAAKEPPNFRVSLSVEAIGGGYACSLVVLMEDLKVWASDHYVKFFPEKKCVLGLMEDGDLRVMDWEGKIGWQTRTSRQGVKGLYLQKDTGNLILADAKNQTKWQTFDNPTDVLLWGQRLNVPACLTSSSTNSSASYSLEIQKDKVVAYLKWREENYSYWEFEPRSERKIAFAKLGSRGLKLFDNSSQKIAQILAVGSGAAQYFALGSEGNLGLYSFSNYKGKFKASYKALRFCDLPLPCGVYGICSSTSTCRYLQLSSIQSNVTANLKQGIYNELCGVFGAEVVMVKLRGVVSVLRTPDTNVNVSQEECVESCLEDCSCAAVLYSDGSGINSERECSHYGLVAGAREVEGLSGLGYWVKLPKGTARVQGISSSLLAKILIIGGAIDGVALCVILGGLLYYFLIIRKRAVNSSTDNN